MRALPMLLFGPRDFRQLAHVFDRGPAKFFSDDRQQPMPHAIPKKSNVPIRRIFPPALPTLAQKFLQCSAPEAEQWPQHFSERSSLLLENNARMNTRKSANSRTAKDALQYRLCLIVERMRGRNLVHATLLRQLAKKTVAQFPRPRLDPGTLAGTNFGAKLGAPIRANRRLTNIQFERVLP